MVVGTVMGMITILSTLVRLRQSGTLTSRKGALSSP